MDDLASEIYETVFREGDMFAIMLLNCLEVYFFLLCDKIEEVLYQIPSVMEVCVFGVPVPYRSETVKARIVLKENARLTETEVRLVQPKFSQI